MYGKRVILLLAAIPAAIIAAPIAQPTWNIRELGLSHQNRDLVQSRGDDTGFGYHGSKRGDGTGFGYHGSKRGDDTGFGYHGSKRGDGTGFGYHGSRNIVRPRDEIQDFGGGARITTDENSDFEFEERDIVHPTEKKP